MKETLKNILKALQLYHPLQLFYRNCLRSLFQLKLRWKYRRMKGAGFTCNNCGASYKNFEAYHPAHQNREAIIKNQVIAGYGENIFCPSCLSNARERLVIAMLNDQIEFKGKKILLLSPEKAIFQFLKKDARIVTADLLPGFYRNIDPAIRKQDITQMTIPSASFDIVVANHVMEHIPEDKKAMKEIFRVLLPGGKAILQVPYSETLLSTIESIEISDPNEQSRLYGQKDHIRIYALKDYIQRLQDCGFDVELIPYTALSPYYKFAIQEGEHFLTIRKPLSA